MALNGENIKQQVSECIEQIKQLKAEAARDPAFRKRAEQAARDIMAACEKAHRQSDMQLESVEFNEAFERLRDEARELIE